MTLSSGQSMWGGDETQHFFHLGPEKVLDAVEKLGPRSTGRCLALNSLENRVYEVEVETSGPFAFPEGHDASFVVAKFYRPGRWTKEQILEEHRFLLDLQEEEVPVVAPLSLEGETLLSLEGTGLSYAVFPKKRGRILDEFDDTHLEILGRLLARTHNCGAKRPFHHRLTLNPATYGLKNLQSLLRTSILPSHLERTYSDLVQALCQKMAPQFAKVPLQRIHGDCHKGNILWGSDGPFLVDFDDSVQGPLVQDFWMLLPERSPETRREWDLFLNAYEQMGSFDDSTLGLIDFLRTLRVIHFNTWIAMRWSDPSFPKSFPHFGSEAYWQEQIGFLREQLSV